MPDETFEALRARIVELEGQLEVAQEAQETLDAIRSGKVESLVIEGPDGPRIFSLEWTSYSYRVLLESLSEGAATMGENGVVLYCNPRFAEMLRAPLQQVMGNPLRQWIPERWRPTLEALLRNSADGDGRGELCLRTSDGLELRTHLSFGTIHDDGGRVYCLVATDLGAQKLGKQPVGDEAAAPIGSEPAPFAEVSQVRALATETEQFEKEHLLRALALTHGKRARCAELLQISRRTLWLKLRKHGIARSDTGT